MTITFLGTSHGVPEATRKCTSVMITSGESRYIIDAGVPLITVLNAMRVDLSTIKGVFLTHLHGDHANGLIEFVDLLTWYYKDIRPMIYLPEIAGRNAIKGWLNVTHGGKHLENMPDMTEITEGAFFDDGVIKLTAISNEHLPDRPSYSFMLEAEGMRVVFTGDLSGMNNYHDFPKQAYELPCDLVVTEAAHCLLTNAVDMFSKLTTKKLVVSHIAPMNEPEVEKLDKLVSYDVIKAQDGMVIEL